MLIIKNYMKKNEVTKVLTPALAFAEYIRCADDVLHWYGNPCNIHLDTYGLSCAYQDYKSYVIDECFFTNIDLWNYYKCSSFKRIIEFLISTYIFPLSKSTFNSYLNFVDSLEDKAFNYVLNSYNYDSNVVNKA